MSRLGHLFEGPHRSCAVVGVQWGDEGKGKIADILADSADVVARWQGGPNAGHTVCFDGGEYVTHHLPVGVFHAETTNVIGCGCVVDLEALVEEIESLGPAKQGSIVIDPNATVITPWHRLIDAGHDEDEEGEDIVGTTNRGIGPTYASRASRVALRVGDLMRDDAGLMLERLFDWCVSRARADDMTLDPDAFVPPSDVLRHLRGALDELKDHDVRIEPGAPILEASLRTDVADRVLFEGAQGTMLGLRAGNYPYVTSSTPTAAGIAAGCNISPGRVDRTIGVMKAYTTRVGGSDEAFLCGRAMDDYVAEQIRDIGGEYGATTGRPRKVGWLDGPALRYAARVNGFDGVVVTKVDVLAELGRQTDVEHVDFLDDYRSNDAGEEPICTFEPTLDAEALTPGSTRSSPIWTEEVRTMRRRDRAPEPLRAFLDFVAEQMETDVAAVSVGPDREAIAT